MFRCPAYGARRRTETGAASRESFTIAVDVDLGLLNVSVRDKHGHIVSRLTEKNFTIEEDGTPRRSASFIRKTFRPPSA